MFRCAPHETPDSGRWGLRTMKTAILCMTLLVVAGCRTVTPEGMKRIETSCETRSIHLSGYQNAWYYAGSDDQYDYVVHNPVLNALHRYRIRRGELTLPASFKRTRNRSHWIRINANGKRWLSPPPPDALKVFGGSNVPNKSMHPTKQPARGSLCG